MAECSNETQKDQEIHIITSPSKNQTLTDYEKELETYKAESKSNNVDKQCNKDTKTFEPKPDVIQLKIFPDNHPLSMEEQLFYIKITEGIFGYNEQTRNDNLKTLATDYNIKFLMPYLCTFIKETIHLNIAFTDLTLLIYSVRMTKSLLANPYVSLKNYLHEILPAILSCALAKKISKYYYDNHWTLRDFSAYIVAAMCQSYSNKTNNITTRVVNVYLKAIQGPSKPLTTVYGALKGLGSLGEETIRIFLLPHLGNIGKRLYVIFERKVFTFYPEEKHKQQVIEAKHVRDVILNMVAPILLKTKNTNDGGLSYLNDFGYLGRSLYIQVKNLEKIEAEKQKALTFGKTITASTSYLHNFGTASYLRPAINAPIQNVEFRNPLTKPSF